jgi:phospholipase C
VTDFDIDPTRRRVLRGLGLGAGAAMLGGAPAALRAAMEIPAHDATRSIRDVQHVVILMLENRSFDHYFGTLPGVRGFGDRFPIPLESGKPVWYQSDGRREVTPFHLDMATMNAIKSNTTSHTFPDTQAAWNQGKFGHWPKFKIDLVTGEATGHSMGYFREQEIPFQWALANAFTLCDNYFCSVLSGTDPNRIVFWSGSNADPRAQARGEPLTAANSEPNNLRCWVLKGWKPGNWPTPGYQYLGSGFDWPTLPEVLQAAGVGWRIYQDPNDNWTGAMHGCLAFDSFRKAAPGSPIYVNGMSRWTLADLEDDVRRGRLPQVSWILPSQAQSEHAAGSSPASGAEFTHNVLKALVANPEVWSRTALFVTFDENDGFFDHVPNPAVPSYERDGTLAGKSTVDVKGMYFDAGDNRYDDEFTAAYTGQARTEQYLDDRDTTSGRLRPFGMGPRVPMYVISPWSRGGWVCSQVFDHTSVGMFIEKRFGVTVPAISPWHRAVSGDLTGAFDFQAPNDPRLPPLPDTTGYAALEARQRTMPAAVAPARLRGFAQAPGVRPARALPYVLHADGVRQPDGAVQLRFAAEGPQGAVFHVYDRRHLDRIPRRYTVGAGERLEDRWQPTADDRGRYDLWVYGPNGWVRSLAGDPALLAAGAAPEVDLRYDPARAEVVLRARNSGSVAVSLDVRDNAYGAMRPQVLDLPPASSRELRCPVARSANWYDLTASVPGWQRRFAGRMEDGRPGSSDPAMGRG